MYPNRGLPCFVLNIMHYVSAMPDRLIVRVGGAAFIVAALSFTVVFIYLAVAFDYPEILDGPADQVLPRLVSLGAAGRAVWSVYALLPLLLLPGAVGAARAVRTGNEGLAQLGVYAALVAAICMVLGLVRWPSVHWALAHAYVEAMPESRAAMAAVFDGLNLYLGNYLGEFIGELCLYGFFMLLGGAAYTAPEYGRWFSYGGITVALIGWVAMFRNVTDVVDPVSDVANGVLPLWMLIVGVVLLQNASSEAASGEATPTWHHDVADG